MFLIHEYLIPFHAISYNLDMIFYRQSLYTFECIKVYLIHFWMYQKWFKTRCPVLIGLKVYQSSVTVPMDPTSENFFPQWNFQIKIAPLIRVRQVLHICGKKEVTACQNMLINWKITQQFHFRLKKQNHECDNNKNKCAKIVRNSKIPKKVRLGPLEPHICHLSDEHNFRIQDMTLDHVDSL